MQTTLYTTPAGFDSLAADWNALVERSVTNVPFLRLEWQQTWWTHLGEGELLLVAVRAGDGQLIGLAPLFRLDKITHMSLNTVGCVDVSDYLDLIVARGHETAVYEALLDALAGPDAPAWDTWSLCNVPAASPTLSWLPELAAAHGYGVSKSVQEVCPIVRLPSTWEGYLELLDKKDRHELRRKMRRAEEAGASMYLTRGEESLDADIDAFIELLIKSRPDKAEFMDASMRAFFHAAAHAARQAGWLLLSFAEVQGVKAAAYLNFDYANTVMLYNSGFDMERFGHLSLGNALAGWSIQHAIEQGRAAFDFLRGNEAYKYRLGGVDTQIYRLELKREIRL
ncbi:MAG: GNAT family N-acetyltransferase [Thermoflexales bacterium]|nr:GNAT family N-acetyltransferase [Thermoflexales bacterium]